MRFCAAEIDKLGHLFKDLFGELHDRFDPIELVERAEELANQDQIAYDDLKQETVEAARVYSDLADRHG